MSKIFTMSAEGKSEYCCNVVRIGEIKPIEGSDFLGETMVNGQSAVVRKDQVHEGDLFFYASNECQLNEKFLSVNNLFEIGSYELNSNAEEVKDLLSKADSTEDKDERDKYRAEAKHKVGFFNKNGRVRMIRLRKVPSYGFLFGLDEMARYCPKVKGINMEDYLNQDFDTVDGELFVKAYVPYTTERTHPNGNKRNRKAQKKINRFDRMIPGEFMLHYDTNPLAKNMWRIKPDDVVTISVKLHGCVKEDTIINTLEYGDMKIGDIVNNKIECHIKAYDTEINETIYVPIDNFYTIPNDGEWYEIELEDGKKITITGNNPIYIPSTKAYRRVDELKGDETLLISE